MPKKYEPVVSRRLIIFLITAGVALYVLVPQFKAFHSSWHLLATPRAGWLLIAITATSLSYLSGAGTYYWLAFKRLQYLQILLVQFAAMFINRLTPAGVGALGINYLYLIRVRHSSAQAAVTVGVNNFIGMFGHSLLFALALLLITRQPSFLLKYKPPSHLVPILAFCLLVGGALALTLTSSHWRRWLKQVRRQLFSYRKRPLDLALALLTSLSLTLANIICLYACALALGVHVDLPAVFIIFSFGLFAGNIVPLPGGLVGFEAGLTAGLLAYGLPSATALAIALLYRLVSYWLPLIAGAAAFIVVDRRGLIKI